MNRNTAAALVSLATFTVLAVPLLALLPAEAVTVAPYVPVVVTLAALAGFLVANGRRMADRPRVTGPDGTDR
jgi:hypothetical protein